MSDLLKWAAVRNNLVVHGSFDAPQELIDNFHDRVVESDYVVTPPWYDETVEFVDVTNIDPRPIEGWYRDSSGTWMNGNPTLTVDRNIIPPDDVSSATITFSQQGPKAPASITFDVNGQMTSSALINGKASLSVTSSNPGDVILVIVESQSVTINVGT